MKKYLKKLKKIAWWVYFNARGIAIGSIIFLRAIVNKDLLLIVIGLGFIYKDAFTLLKKAVQNHRS